VSVRSVVLLEFNELSPTLMARFIAEGHLPNFQRLYRESQVFVTRATETPPALEPWIQWVNVHTGLDYAEHGVFNLDEGHKLRRPAVWDLLSREGHPVLVFGSMNARYDEPVNGCIVPDPWTTSLKPHPPELDTYFRFVQKNVVDYTGKVRVSLGERLRFLAFMASHGLSWTTVVAIVHQLFSELGGRDRWKRAVLLDKLQFDVFSWYYRRLRPRFSTFFLNSTAHFQHLYWRSFEPEKFSVKPNEREQATYGSAILFGYQEMDRLIGRFYRLTGNDTVLVLCTALSQQPCLTYEESGGKVAYRPRDFEALLAFAGVTVPHRVSPVMAEEFHVYCEREQDLERAEVLLRGLYVGDRPALRVRRQENGLLAGCGIFQELPADARLRRAAGGETAGFFDIFYRIEGVKSGMHHPDGLLWIRNPGEAHRVVEEKVALAAIAPTLLSYFAVEPPPFMQAESLRNV
jgi:hypothetical protein